MGFGPNTHQTSNELPQGVRPHVGPYHGLPSAPDVMPPWLQEFHENFHSLHTKADRQHQDILTFGAEVQAQAVRIAGLGQVANEHTLKHESTATRLSEQMETQAATERRITELLKETC